MCPARPTCGESFRQETINYDFDARQSAETRNKINQILDVGQYCNITSLSVTGHTDTSGPAAYNLKLSMDRAADAKSELERQGVSVPVTSDGKGETQLKVQTANGVRNEENRRTEVLMTLSTVIPAMMNN
jgi:outer membrane protein OmpA-like peptidoglycan-associated protein